MKYRILTNDELQALEDDFKQFLIVNHVYAEEWEVLNQSDPAKALQLVELFSDTVLQRVYERIQFLEFRSADTCIIFYVGKEKIALITIQSKSSEVDLSTPESIHHALTKQIENLQFFRSEREYKKERETEVHQLVEQGCLVSSEEFWNALNTSIGKEH
jgi:hypothetical protein